MGKISHVKVRDVVESRLTLRRLFLSRQTGNDPALTGLLRVFKDYYPEIIVGDATRGKASAFKVWPCNVVSEHMELILYSTPISSGGSSSIRSKGRMLNLPSRDPRGH